MFRQEAAYTMDFADDELRIPEDEEFPGGPVIRIPCFHCTGSILGQGTGNCGRVCGVGEGWETELG